MRILWIFYRGERDVLANRVRSLGLVVLFFVVLFFFLFNAPDRERQEIDVLGLRQIPSRASGKTSLRILVRYREVDCGA